MAGAAAGRVADAEDSGHLPPGPSLCETMPKLFSLIDFPPFESLLKLAGLESTELGLATRAANLWRQVSSAAQKAWPRCLGPRGSNRAI